MVVEHFKEDIDSLLRTCILKNSKHDSVDNLDELLHFKVDAALMKIVEDLALVLILVHKLQ